MQQQVSNKMGKEQQKTGEVVESFKTPFYNIPQKESLLTGDSIMTGMKGASLKWVFENEFYWTQKLMYASE